MKKILFLFTACFLIARENPFVPTTELNTDVVVTNLTQEFEPFSQLEITLDKGDMLLDEVVLYTVQKDGSKRKQSIKVNKSIDNSDSYVLTQTKNTICKPCDIPVSVPEIIDSQIATPPIESDDSSSDKSSQEIAKTSDLEPRGKSLDEPNKIEVAPQISQILTTQIEKNQENKPQDNNADEIIDSFRFKNLVSFEIGNGWVKIYTNTKLIRDFVYKNEKIVLDFKAKFRQFLTFSKSLKSAGFDLVNIGAHNGYFRVVIVPKKFKDYILRSIDGGYKLEI